MTFPVLFAAGMSLVGTTDGVLTLGAYEPPFVKPIRKLCYKLAITLISVVVVIGGIEALGLLAGNLDLEGPVWGFTDGLNDNFNDLGLAIIGVFIVARVASPVIYRLKGYDRLESRIS
jgi:high-affinity nickel-transport protein